MSKTTNGRNFNYPHPKDDYTKQTKIISGVRRKKNKQARCISDYSIIPKGKKKIKRKKIKFPF